MRRRQIDRTQLSAVLLSIALTASIVGVVALAPVAADSHTKSNAPQLNEEADITISAVSQSDHHPGDQNQGGGSLQYFASGSDAFGELGAEDGLYIDYIILDADWIDYSACTVDNTAAFGMDRGGDNEGTNYDEDLVQKQKQTDFRDDGITIEFYNWGDLGGDPPYMAPADEIVAQQGEGSAGGECMTMTSEPGWYRIDGFLNGTVADNGQGEQPSENAEQVGLNTKSDYFYICDCESEEEAREQLGPPPNEEGSGETSSSGGESTPTPTPSSETSGGESTASEGGEATAEEEPSGAESGGGEGGEPTAEEGSSGTESGGSEGGEPTEGGTAGGESSAGGANESGAGNGSGAGEANGSNAGAGNDSDVGGAQAGEDDGQQTPSANDGPGFGALVAILAVFGSALLLTRRR